MNKFSRFKLDLYAHYSDNISINLSPASSFRNRCEFSYSNNSFVMHDGKSKIYITHFTNATPSIQKIMPLILNIINNNKLIKNKLFQINFRSNSSEDVLITLIYHKPLCSKIKETSQQIAKKLNVKIILRAKNEIYPVENIYFEDYLITNNIKIYQTDNCFYQPNKFLLPLMIKKVMSYVNNPKDLIELYCGVGTFSLPLSSIFKNVLVTENNRDSIRCLNKGIEINNISNIHSARLSASEVVELFNGRIFTRMNDVSISKYNFTHILVDPPRSGLTDEVIKLISKFKNIIYISCNPETYIRDIKLLNKHKIVNIEIFDQFPNTNHLEIVSLLSIN